MTENTEEQKQPGEDTTSGAGAAPTAAAEETTAAAPAASETPKRKMRMLTDGVEHKAGEVLEFDNEKAVELIHAGLAESAE